MLRYLIFFYKLVKNKYALTYKNCNYVSTVVSLTTRCTTQFTSKVILLISCTASDLNLNEWVNKCIEKRKHERLAEIMVEGTHKNIKDKL